MSVTLAHERQYGNGNHIRKVFRFGILNAASRGLSYQGSTVFSASEGLYASTPTIT
jgi:hypothetical protein